MHRTGHAHFVRSPHGHARIVSIDVSRAMSLDGVYTVLTGEEAKEMCATPFWIAPQQERRRHHDPWSAVAALEAVLLVEGLLHGRELTVAREPLNRLDLRSVGLGREHHAALDQLAVDDHRAGSAAAGVTADVSPLHSERVADEVHE
jgi:hypothetical protein